MLRISVKRRSVSFVANGWPQPLKKADGEPFGKFALATYRGSKLYAMFNLLKRNRVGWW